MKNSIFAVASLIAACSASHERGETHDGGSVDAGLDAGPVDARWLDAELPDGLAPRCTEIPMAPCLRLASRETFRTGEPGAYYGDLHGLAYAEGPAVFYAYRFNEGRGLPTLPARYALQRFTAEGVLAGEPVFLTDEYDTGGPGGGDLTVWEGDLVAGWDHRRFDESYTPPAVVGADTFTLRVSAGLRAGPMHSGGRDVIDGSDVSVAAGLVITSRTDGLWVSRIEGTGEPVVIHTERAPVDEVRSAALASRRAVVVWSEDHAMELRRELATEAAVVNDSALEAQARVFEPSFAGGAARSAPSVVAIGDDIWVARYDEDFAHLDQSRIRIAHLDASLRRVEPDRWFGGWGGLTPSGMALVVWRGAPWLVWATLDARYGASLVLYARPIPEPVCGYEVSDPVVVRGPDALADSLDQLLATSSPEALWVVTPDGTERGTADLYQFRFCE